MPSSLVKSFAKKTGTSIDRVEALWKKAKGISRSSGFEDGEDDFYAYTVGVLKKMLKIRTEAIRRGKIAPHHVLWLRKRLNEDVRGVHLALGLKVPLDERKRRFFTGRY